MPVQSRFYQIPDNIRVQIFSYLDPVSKWNILQSSEEFASTLNSSRRLLLELKLEITPDKFDVLSKGGFISKIQYKNISIKSDKKIEKLKKLLKSIKNFKNSIEIIEIEDFKKTPIDHFIEFFYEFSNLRILKLFNCTISEKVHNQIVGKLSSLEKISFEKCDANLFKLFKKQESVVKVSVRNDIWTWNGFSHEDFNDLLRTLPNIDRITFKGVGCGSYFDNDDHPFKIRKLKTTLITFHWYIGIRTARVSFLRSQIGNLKVLMIEELPYDFDGGRVLEFIIEEMKLETFCLRKTQLIHESKKQDIDKFGANEIQVTSIYEMFRQFPSITSFELCINQTDIDSSEIERLTGPTTNRFNNLKYLSVIDKSNSRRTLGVFLGFFKNLRNLISIKLQTQDSNINTLLGVFLPHMPHLRNIEIDSRNLKIEERFQIIRNFAPNLETLHVDSEFMEMAREIFEDVTVNEFNSQ